MLSTQCYAARGASILSFKTLIAPPGRNGEVFGFGNVKKGDENVGQRDTGQASMPVDEFKSQDKEESSAASLNHIENDYKMLKIS